MNHLHLETMSHDLLDPTSEASSQPQGVKGQTRRQKFIPKGYTLIRHTLSYL